MLMLSQKTWRPVGKEGRRVSRLKMRWESLCGGRGGRGLQIKTIEVSYNTTAGRGAGLVCKPTHTKGHIRGLMVWTFASRTVRILRFHITSQFCLILQGVMWTWTVMVLCDKRARLTPSHSLPSLMLSVTLPSLMLAVTGVYQRTSLLTSFPSEG